MFGVGFLELVVVVVICLLMFGPGKVPEVGAVLGKSLRAFQQVLDPPPEEAAASSPSPAATTSAFETHQDTVG